MLDFVAPEDAKKSTSLKIFFTINAVVCSVNIVFDYYLVKATLKNKSLHKACPILIAIYFLCQLFVSAGIFITFAIVILPSAILDSVTMQTCAIINFVPEIAFYGYYSLIVVIAFDRLLSVYFPLWYAMRLSTKWHILFVTIFSSALPLYISICVIQSGIKYGNLKTTCLMAELLRDELQFQAKFQTATNGGALICYLAIFAKFVRRRFFNKTQANPTGVSPMDLQVLKAVGLIMCVQAFMWILSTMFLGMFIQLVGPLDKIGSLEFATAVGTTVSFLYALEVPILYLTSSLHRAALKNELKWLQMFYCKNNQIQNLIIVRPQIN